MEFQKTLNDVKSASGSTAKKRKTASGDVQVVVIEEAGELTAIVMDKMRGMVRIPLGRD